MTTWEMGRAASVRADANARGEGEDVGEAKGKDLIASGMDEPYCVWLREESRL